MKSYQISLVTQIPAHLHQSLQDYLNTHPDSDQDQVFTEALARFLQEQNNPKRQPKIVMI